MKQLKEVIEVKNEGLISLLNEKVLLLCANYFYCGILEGVNDEFVKLKDPSIIYSTGDWSESDYSDKQKLHTDVFYVQKCAIESYGKSK